MTEKMYNHIVDNLHKVNVNIDTGVLTTARGTNGTVCSSTGYIVFKLSGKKVQLHQVIAVMVYGSDCIGMTVNHKDGNKFNNSASNLELLTRADNARHEHISGLAKYVYGEEKGTSKLREGQVLEIREKLNKGVSQRKIASEYGVSKNTINCINLGKTWRHVV